MGQLYPGFPDFQGHLPPFPLTPSPQTPTPNLLHQLTHPQNLLSRLFTLQIQSKFQNSAQVADLEHYLPNLDQSPTHPNASYLQVAHACPQNHLYNLVLDAEFQLKFEIWKAYLNFRLLVLEHRALPLYFKICLILVVVVLEDLETLPVLLIKLLILFVKVL